MMIMMTQLDKLGLWETYVITGYPDDGVNSIGFGVLMELTSNFCHDRFICEMLPGFYKNNEKR